MQVSRICTMPGASGAALNQSSATGMDIRVLPLLTTPLK